MEMARDRARRSPARTRSTSSCMDLPELKSIRSLSAAAVVTNRLILQDLPRDHQTLNLAGAFSDSAQLHVAIELLRRIVLDESVTAENLHALVGAAHRDLAAIELCHRGFLRGLHAGIFHGGGALRQ